MRRVLISVAVATASLMQNVAAAEACGDKLLVLGRGIRFQSRHTPRAAKVLLYVPATGAGRSLTDPKLESALREAGHDVRAVTTIGDLDTALASGAYDVVLANITDAPDLERAEAITDRAVVLPAVYLIAPDKPTKEQAKADVSKAAKEFSVVLEVPGRPGHYCALVDKAMELRLKRQQAATRRP
jgi:ABC-type amino acid transport substrate-binding protein